ncbi:MAG: hypothetical protein HYZ34_01825, partial [Ignavibacteriae bacterium]|nr:hypothetical protein [Ignavibacteriota bacterium]
MLSKIFSIFIVVTLFFFFTERTQSQPYFLVSSSHGGTSGEMSSANFTAAFSAGTSAAGEMSSPSFTTSSGIMEVTVVPSSVSGYKFNDLDADGIWDQPDEPPLEGWTIVLSPSDSSNPIRSEITNASGEYFFANVVDENYRVYETQQSSWTQTAPSGGQYTITVVGGNSFANLNFGNTRLGTIRGYKYNDLNGNGLHDSTSGDIEPLLSGWTIQLSGTANQSTTTDASGQFSFTNLPVGTYTVNEVQKNGWIQTYPPSPGTHTINLNGGYVFIMFGNTGTSSISGKVFEDPNNHCVQDGSEYGLKGRKIKLEPGNRYTFSDANGNYTFASLGAETYTISLEPKQFWGQTCPASSSSYIVPITGNQTVTGKDFGSEVTQYVQDLSVYMWASYPSPLRTPCCGQKMTYGIYYENSGSVPVSGAQVILNLTAHGDFVSFTATPSLSNPNQPAAKKYVWDLPDPFLPGASGYIYVECQLTCVLPASPMIVSHVRIDPLSTDDVKPNNEQNHMAKAECSYDPNDKAVTPAGCGAEGFITADDSLTYKIQFQNLGTGPAYLVVVRDTLDEDVDVSTVTNLGSSHLNTFEITGRELKWTFWDIILPPAIQDEPGSHGFITFSVEQMPTNPVGTVIENDASIYFDLNEAVVTNTTTNTITNTPLPVSDFTVSENCISGNCTYDFTYTGGTNGATFSWDFGFGANPETSSVEHPTGVSYSVSGPKIITLQVKLGECSSEPSIALVEAEITTTVSFSVNNGWNIVSVPVIPSDYSKDSLFPTATSPAFTFAGGYTLENPLRNGVGYWMKFPSAQTIQMEGWRTRAESLTVAEGWNMVGSISERTRAESLTTEPLTMTTSSFFGYDRGYYITEYIEPGKGYWVKTDTAGIVIL